MRWVQLPSDVLPIDDPRRDPAEFADSMIKTTRWIRFLALPITVLVISVAAWIAVGLFGRGGYVVVVFGMFLFAFLRVMHTRPAWGCDFRPPFLVLRSHSDLRTKLGDELPVGDDGMPDGRNPYIWQLSHSLWDWGRMILLLDETPDSRLRVNAVILKTQENDWQQSVLSVARRCWLVVVFPSPTKGCVEELCMLASDPGLLEKTILFMPPTPKGLNRFLSRGNADFSADWEAVRMELSAHKFNLPAYDPRGMLFVPTEVFDVKRSISLKHVEGPWERLCELVERPVVSADSLWNILNYGMAYESEDSERQLGWLDAKLEGVMPGVKISY
jgi:hypothetical protein